MAQQKTEISSRAVVRYSNEESKQITRDCIETALIQLLHTKSLESISITEIVTRAGVSRTAFYRNYQSKEEVLESALGFAINRIIRTMTLDMYKRQFWISLLSEVKACLDSFQLLLSVGFGDRILEQITTHVLQLHTGDCVEKQYADIFWVGAVYNILIHWVKSGAQESVETMTEICMHILKDAE